MNNETIPNNKKNLWIAAGILLTLTLCGLVAWFGSGMLTILQRHLGM